MIDLTNYNEDGLSKVVLSDEILYTLATEDITELMETIQDTFAYTEAQMDTLRQDLEEL